MEALLYTMFYWIFLYLLFFAGVVYLLYIPLPADIADRWKLQVLEAYMRFTIEYLGDVVEAIFGVVARNTYLRYVMALGFLRPAKVPPYLTVSEEKIGGVDVRVYVPKERKSKGALIFIHGGGWATMKAKYYDNIMFPLVRRTGVVIFSIDYRLAPEFPFPIPADDCEAAVRAIYKTECKKYDIDTTRIAIGGDSAGGNLTAVVTQRLARDQLNFIKCQILIYPVVHVFGFRSPSYMTYYRKFNGSSVLSPRSMARWILFYMGIEANKSNIEKLQLNQHVSEELAASKSVSRILGSAELPQEFREEDESLIGEADKSLASIFAKKGTNPDVSPIFGVQKGLPPALVITAGYDVLRDEGIHYAKRLMENGVKTSWKHHPRAFHGMLNMPKSKHQRAIFDQIVEYLQENL